MSTNDWVTLGGYSGSDLVDVDFRVEILETNLRASWYAAPTRPLSKEFFEGTNNFHAATNDWANSIALTNPR
ncbi:hypothetical protein P4E94_18520 [Pontiellaceae bacterium B12219]|nr:hypothetical protein [Pontiellaceae bacterium B12219]